MSANMYQQTVSQMIADIGLSTDGDFNQSSRPPHPDSINGPLVEWCKRPAEEQVWLVEERGFERRLKAEVQARHEAGWDHQRLVRFVNHHRSRWRDMRRGTVPKSLAKKDDPYMQARNDIESPLPGFDDRPFNERGGNG